MDIQIFKENGWEIRTIEKDGEPWFIAKDICESIGLSNTTMAVKSLDDDELTKLNLGGQHGETTIVSESGMYTMVLRSREAVTDGTDSHKFKRWVTKEVLPAIRKNGGYIMASDKESQADFDERVGKIVAAAMAPKEKELLRYKKALALTTTSVDFRSFATKGGKEWTISDAADEFSMPMSELRVALRSASFFRTRVMPGGQKRWWPKEKYFDSMHCKHVDGGINYAFNAKGMEWLTVLLENGNTEAMAKFELERQLELFE